MCNDCFNKLIHKFDSEKEFENFEIILRNKCIESKIVIVEVDHWAGVDPYEYFKCNSCGETWVHSFAKDAWRGFFLTQKEAIKFTNELREKDKVRRIGCLVIIVILILVVIFQLFK